MILVIKRDGSREPFDPRKIARVVVAAGLRQEQAENLSRQVDTWAQSQTEAELSSLVIRDRVLSLLREVDESAANLYAWYQKTKN